MLKEKIEKVLRKEFTFENIGWSILGESDEIQSIMSTLNEESIVDFFIEHLSTGCDSYYATTYYCKKLDKTLIWEYDPQVSFENFDEFVRFLVRTTQEIKSFEDKIKNI